LLISGEADERGAGQFGIALGHHPHQLEEQGQWAWCRFMLQRTLLR